MAAISSPSHRILDITTCSICLETFKEPKALPCIHTFCLRCLDSYYGKMNKEEELSCPLCRKVFLIPPGGFQKLPNNFFIQQLLNVNKTSHNTGAQKSVKRVPCELCSDSEGEITSFCIECEQHICDRCSVIHSKIKLTKSHLVLRSAYTESSPKRIKLTENYCERHSSEQNQLYCYDCKTIMCRKCLSSHNQHKCSDVDEATAMLRDQLNDDVNILSASVLERQTNLKRLELDNENFLKKVASTEDEISQKCGELVSIGESNKCRLIQKLNKCKDKIMKKVETEKIERERQLVITESFKRYCLEMSNKGTAFDISRTAHDLHARAEELSMNQDEPKFHGLSEIEITFKPSLSATNGVENFIGELVFRGEGCEAEAENEDEIKEVINLTSFLTKPPTLVHFMPKFRQRVAGITALGSYVYVVRHTAHVNVYNSDDFTSVRNLKITGAGTKNLRGVVSCSHHNCLYATDSKQADIYRFDLVTEVTTTWRARDQCYGLSVTKSHNVLATLCYTQRIRECNTHGVVIRDISLDSSIKHPLHCVQLSTGNFVVCHAETEHRVCIVDQSGQIILSYGGSPGSGVGQINDPFYLAVDMNDNVLVTDSLNDRVQLLSPTLTLLGDIGIPGHKLKDAYTLHYDERNHRLFIGEWSAGRLFVVRAS